jgi:hypothetical protein
LQEDFSWENTEPSAWSIGELSSAVTCACLPTLTPLVAKYFPKQPTTGHRSNSALLKEYNSGGTGGPNSQRSRGGFGHSRNTNKDLESHGTAFDTTTGHYSEDNLYIAPGEKDRSSGSESQLPALPIDSDSSAAVVGLQSVREDLLQAAAQRVASASFPGRDAGAHG